MWTREILDYIEQNKWKDEIVPERLKCFFTTWTHEYMIRGVEIIDSPIELTDR